MSPQPPLCEGGGSVGSEVDSVVEVSGASVGAVLSTGDTVGSGVADSSGEGDNTGDGCGVTDSSGEGVGEAEIVGGAARIPNVVNPSCPNAVPG